MSSGRGSEGQQAVIVQFSRPVGEPVTEASLHVKLPFIQDVRRFEKRLLSASELVQIRSTAYRRVQEVRGKADAGPRGCTAAPIAATPSSTPSRARLEAYREGQNKNSTLILTAESDYYKYLEKAARPAGAR